MYARFERVRPTSLRALCLACAAYAAVLVSLVCAYSGRLGETLDAWHESSNGWIAPHLVMPLLALAVVSPAVFGLGRLRAADVGWRPAAVASGAALTLLAWLAIQGALWLVVVLRGEEPAWDWRLRDYKLAILASVVVHLAGVGLLEETFFRGYLLPQVFLRVARARSRGVALVAAVAISLGLFVLSHVPRLVMEDKSALELGSALYWTVRFGAVLTLLYLVTGNVFACVGLHALWNAFPMLIEFPPESARHAWWAVTAGLVAAGWGVARFRSRARRTSEACSESG